MPLELKSISIPILTLNEGVPKSSGPVGRLERLENAVAVKHDGPKLSIGKRPGITPFTGETRAVVNAALMASTFGPQNARLLGTLGERLVAVGDDDHPYVLSDSAWEYYSYILLTHRLGRTPVYAADTQTKTPDGASVGTVYCYVWTTATSAFAMLVDADGTVIRTPFTLDVAGRIKVVSDGTYFWIFHDAGGVTVRVTILDTDGAVVVSSSAIDTLAAAPRVWDVTYQPSVGVSYVREVIGTDQLHLSVLTWNGSAVVVSSSDINIPLAPNAGGLGFLLNENSTGHVYVGIARTSGDGGSHVIAYKLSTTAMVQFYDADPVIPLDRGIANITGYVVPGTSNVWVTWAQLDPYTGTATPINNYTRTTFILEGPSAFTSGAATVGTTRRSVSVASRAFRVGSRIVVAAYYSSVVASIYTTMVAQPTYFLMDIATQQICGRFEYGNAAMDWAQVGWNGDPNFGTAPTYGFLLPSAFSGDGKIHLPLGYRASSFTIQTVASLGTFVDPISGNTIALNFPINHYTGAVGLIDITFGSPGKAVEYADELLLPGPQATSFSGVEFTESNIALAPEMPTGTPVNGAGTLTPVIAGAPAVYGIVIVYESVTTPGQRVKSRSSIEVKVTMGATDDTINLVGPTLRVTNRTAVKISVYSTFVLASTGLMSTDHRKVTNDLLPLLNDPTVDTWAYSIATSDNAIAVGEPLYTDGDPAPLDYDPAPPFHCGAIMDNRMMLAGYDGAVWFSFEKTEGQSLAFNGEINRMVRPTSDPVELIAALDTRLVLACSASMWFAVAGQWPDRTGSGSIPTPEILPFANGCTGHGGVIRDGLVYISNFGGPFLLGRDMTNHYIGEPVKDETLLVTQFISVAVDKLQRVHFLTAAKSIVWDPIPACWYMWRLPDAGQGGVAHALSGEMVYAAPTRVWHVEEGVVSDNGVPISTLVVVAKISLADVHGFCKLWEMQTLGTNIGRHNFHITSTPDAGEIPSQTPENFERDSATFPVGASYRWQIKPKQQRCQAVGYAFSDSFVFPRVVTHDVDDAVVATRTFALDAFDTRIANQWVFANAAWTAADLGRVFTPAFAAPNTAFNVPFTITQVWSPTLVSVTPDPMSLGAFTPPSAGTVTVTDSVGTWRFDNANFQLTDIGGTFTVAGAANAGNNGTFTILTRPDGTHVTTAITGQVDETFGAAVTLTVTPTIPSAGFTLESIGMALGVEPGLGKNDRRQRMAPT